MSLKSFAARFLSLVAAVSTGILMASCNDKPMLGKTPIARMLEYMSVDEKASLLVVDWNANGSALVVQGIERLGIPTLSLQPAYGLDMQAVQSLSRSWNAELAFECGAAMAREYCQSVSGDCTAHYMDLSSFPPYSCAVDSAQKEHALSVAQGIVNGIAGQDCPAAVLHSCSDPVNGVFDRTVLDMAACVNDSQVVAILNGACHAVRAGRAMAVAAIGTAYRNGMLDMTTIDRHVVEVLEFVSLVMRRADAPKTDETEPADSLHLSNLWAQCHRQGAVLLKNGNVIPLSANRGRVALYGLGAYMESVRLDSALQSLSYQLEPAVRQAFVNTMTTGGDSLARKPFQYRADAIMSQAAVVLLEDNTGELAMLQDVCSAFHSKNRPVILAVTDRTRVAVSLIKDGPDAILLVQSCGKETGNIIARILNGSLTATGRIACPLRSLPQYVFGDGITNSLN